MSTEGVTDLASFVAYVQGLAREVGDDPSRCTNDTVPAFLEAVAAWAEDADGYYANRGEPRPPAGSWKGVADLLSAALVYE